MSRWLPFAGLADKYRDRQVQVIFANPFKFNEEVYPKVVATVEKVRLVEGRRNLSVLRQTTHPEVDRHSSHFVPGWNASNPEIAANDEHECLVIFDRSGEIVFQGRVTSAQADQKVQEILDTR